MIPGLAAPFLLLGSLCWLAPAAPAQGLEIRVRLLEERSPAAGEPRLRPGFALRRIHQGAPKTLEHKGTLLLDFLGRAPSAEELVLILQPFEGLALGSLSLRGAKDLEVGDLAPLTKLASLEVLDLGGCKKIGPQALPFLAKLPGLRWLRYEGSGISEVALAQAEGFDQLLTRKVDAWFRKACVARGIVGASLALAWKGRFVYSKGYGWADLERGVPADSQSRYRWASISKPLCAVAALQLREQGKLDIDADIRTYVPEFPEKPLAKGKKITTRLLLGHLGGIVHYRNGKVIKTQREYTIPHPFSNLILSLDNFKESPLIAEPGEKYSYSTHGFILAGAVVRRAGKKAFAEQIEERIARPLGMKSLRPDYQWEEIPDRVRGYRRQGRSGLLPSADTDVSWKLPGGGYLSTVEDLERFGEALVQGKLLAPASYDLLWTSQKTQEGKLTHYGMGFSLQEWQGNELVGHGGAQDKTRTQLLLDPRKGMVVAFMTNCEWVRTGPIGRAVMSLLE